MPLQRNCPICESWDHAPVGHMPSLTHPMHIVGCKGCGLVYVNPMFTNADKEQVSPVLRLLHRSRSTEHSHSAAFRHSMRRMRRCLDLIAPYLKAEQDVLELGSGDGAMLHLLKELGARPTGIEIDSETATAVSCKLGVPVLTASFEDVDLGGKQFDAVVLVHLIEHFFEPVAMLRKAHSLLKPNGLIFVETPNILRPKVGPNRVFSFAHNYHFSPRTLALALYRAGFRCTVLREFRRDSIQIVAQACSPAELGLPPQVHPWQSVARSIHRNRSRYLSSLQFLWRKLPWLGLRVIYRPHRELSGANLHRWLLDPRVALPDKAVHESHSNPHNVRQRS